MITFRDIKLGEFFEHCGIIYYKTSRSEGVDELGFTRGFNPSDLVNKCSKGFTLQAIFHD